MHRFLAPLPFVLVVAGCGPQVNAPSLAPRAVERQSVELPVPTSEAQTPADPAFVARLTAQVDAAEQGDKAFRVAQAQAERAVAAAKGAEPGGEGWTVAQQALSALDIARGPVHEAASQLDTIRQEPAAAGTGNRAAVETAAARIDAIDAGEAAAVAALQGRLR